MGIFTDVNAYVNSPKQKIVWIKTAGRTVVGGVPFTLFDMAGNPGAGTLGGSNTAAGVVPDDSVAGYPVINAFGGTKGAISLIDFGCSVACRLQLFDRLFLAGPYAFNAAVTLAGQPSFAGRVPGGTDFGGLEIWIEAVTAFTGNQSIAVTYTNQSGAAGRTTGTIATGVAPIVGRMLQLPLQAGDNGVQKIESVTSSVSTVGTFNVMVLRRLWTGRVRVTNDGDNHSWDRLGFVEVFANSALLPVIISDGTTPGIPEMFLEVCNG